jgi:hypothetical protein
MPVDHFPSTHATWIDAQLTIAEDGDRAAGSGDAIGRARAESARDALRRHVMERYTPALTAYVSTPELRRVGERVYRRMVRRLQQRRHRRLRAVP